jgi:hypothetical protein
VADSPEVEAVQRLRYFRGRADTGPDELDQYVAALGRALARDATQGRARVAAEGEIKLSLDR